MALDTPEHLIRQADLIPVATLAEEITIIGAGAIGSFTALQLAKMGFGNIRVFDDDKVSVENMNSQFYRFKDIGAPKVEALKSLIEDFTGFKIEAINKRYTGGMYRGIVIAAVDSMEARKLIWKEHAKSVATKAVIDPRMGAETALLYIVMPGTPNGYEKTFYTDREAVQERCTAKATIYTANLLSGMVARMVKAIATGEKKIPTSLQWSISQHDMMVSLPS